MQKIAADGSVEIQGTLCEYRGELCLSDHDDQHTNYHLLPRIVEEAGLLGQRVSFQITGEAERSPRVMIENTITVSGLLQEDLENRLYIHDYPLNEYVNGFWSRRCTVTLRALDKLPKPEAKRVSF